MARVSSRDLLRTASRLAIGAATASLLAGCGGFSSMMSNDAAAEPQMARSTGELTQPDDRDFVGGAAYWGARFEANHNDVNAALAFARNLRLMGGAHQAVTVMKDLVMNHPDDARVLSEYGKALTAAGRAPDAVPFLARASQIDGNDWSTLSAYGVALDQIGSHGQARDNYQAALKLSPNNPVIQSNLALSYLLEGQIALAEPILRQLVARPDATPQMRQNLAMVESIRGDKTEAEQLVRGDLPKSDADNNISVLSQLSASNASVDVQPLSAPPGATPPATGTSPAAAAPAPATLAPTSSAAEGDAAAPPKPATSDQTTPAGTHTMMSPTGRTIVTMAPIADDGTTPAKPAAAKPQVAPSTPTSTTPTPAAPSTPQAATPAAAAAPAPAAPDASSTTPAATAQPTPTTPVPDNSQTSLRSSEPTDPFRPHHEINVANATP